MNKKTSLITSFVAVGIIIVFLFVTNQAKAPEPRIDLPIDEAQETIVPTLEEVAEDLGQIWALAFLPDDMLLATQNSGTLYLINPDTKDVQEISNVPEVDDRGQGGLLDVSIAPDFTVDPWVYLTYSANDGSTATTTHLGRGRLDRQTNQLTDFEVLFVARPFRNTTSHYGSRVVIQDDYLFLSIGDGSDKTFDNHPSQDTSNTIGTIIRLNRDGYIPADNPFVGQDGFADEIYTYGHRNIQGLAINPDTGDLWASEHGEQDGDAIHRIQAGGNYGWPLTHTGCRYVTGQPIGDLPQNRDDIVNPEYFWECGSGGFPPAGMTFYDGDTFPQWQGDLFVGGLASRYLARFSFSDGQLTEESPLLQEEEWRIRDVIVRPSDGSLYLAVEGGDQSIVRIVGREE